jgi:formylglycine-generating enzyme required for sulfatase activity
MKIRAYKTFKKAYRKLPADIQSKIDKQIDILAGDFRYPSLHTKKVKGQDDNHPVVCISWNDAQAFKEWLSRSSGKSYRLPTEAEWEYAARSGGKSYKYSWGNGAPSGNIADKSLKRRFSDLAIWDGYDDGYVYTAPVGRFQANNLGLYDMTGNVWEWCQDWYGEKYYSESPKDNPQGPNSGTYRVLRGGSWCYFPRLVRAAYRFWGGPGSRDFTSGFRLAVFSP